MLDLVEFRAKRDFYQWLRRGQALPALKAQKSMLRASLDDLYRQHDKAAKHDKQIIDNNMRPLQWDYQFVVGQIAVIESEHEALTARVPANWKAQVFEIPESEAA